MSILIKGMEMPKNCDDCFFIGRGYPDWCSFPQIPNGEDEIDDTKKRPDWCPLVELPEKHGRLIDADALIAQQFKNPISYKAFVNLVKRQPTIEERKPGEWLDGYKRQTCSLCKGKGAIFNFPSVQPDITRCKDCRHGVDYYHEGDCYCSNPKWGLTYFGGSWEFYCADAKPKEEP